MCMGLETEMVKSADGKWRRMSAYAKSPDAPPRLPAPFASPDDHESIPKTKPPEK